MRAAVNNTHAAILRFESESRRSYLARTRVESNSVWQESGSSLPQEESLV